MKQIKIRDSFWRVKEVHHLEDGVLGECNYEEKCIYIPHQGDEKHELDVIIHEILHAALPDLKEAAVDETATSIAECLWRLNWRKSFID